MAKKQTPLRRRPAILTICFVLACLMIVGMSVWASSRLWAAPQAQGINPHITNRTKALRVVSMEKTQGAYPNLKVTLLNSSTKAIAAYIISIGDLKIMTDVACGTETFAPGQTKTEQIPINNFRADSSTLEPQNELVIAGVLFEDRSGEGEEHPLTMMRERHQGIKDQLEIFLPILRTVSASGQDTDQILNEIKSRVALLPIEKKPLTTSADYQGGRTWLRDRLNNDLQDLESQKNPPLTSTDRKP